MPATREVYPEHSQPVRLDAELGHGGEGTVFSLLDRPEYAAKLYSRTLLANDISKLRAMVSMYAAELGSCAAWPVDLIRSGRDGDVCGYLMPRLSNFRPLHALYSPVQRKRDFPKADWGFLLNTARNLSFAVDRLHSNGIVIGDVSQNNVLVGEDTRVSFVDCDSFQIMHGGAGFLCNVGTPEYTAPELHSRDLARTIRSPHSDTFGLAVLVFQLMFMGRHPFAGAWRGSGELSLFQAIQQGLYPYSRNPRDQSYSRPPVSAGPEIATTEIADSLERAFETLGGNPSRPTAAEWAHMLSRLLTNLRRCDMHSGHFFASGIGSCPWCHIEASGGPDFFEATVTAATLSSELDSIASPVRSLGSPVTVIHTSALRETRRMLSRLTAVAGPPIWTYLGVALIVGGACTCLASATIGPAGWFFGIGLAIFGLPLVLHQPHRELARSLSTKRYEFEAALAKCESDLSAVVERWTSSLDDMDTLLQDFNLIDQRHHENRAMAVDAIRVQQMRAYLDSQLIMNAD